jgi:hypothetical protein
MVAAATMIDDPELWHCFHYVYRIFQTSRHQRSFLLLLGDDRSIRKPDPS